MIAAARFPELCAVSKNTTTSQVTCETHYTGYSFRNGWCSSFLLTYKSLHGCAPDYLTELCIPVARSEPRRRLRLIFSPYFQCLGTRGVISTFSWGPKFFLFFNATGLLKNWKKQHFICSNLTLFISLGATAPQPPLNDASAWYVINMDITDNPAKVSCCYLRNCANVLYWILVLHFNPYCSFPIVHKFGSPCPLPVPGISSTYIRDVAALYF